MELTLAEQVLLSLTEGVSETDMMKQLGKGYEMELLYLRQLRSCTVFDDNKNTWRKLPCYDDVMSLPIN